ncbi:protein-tyrosine-phosphatase [Malassezia sp. CBS 17886]|nr:protein-tyrosine-phosphatase [Malassezia sp. CBS 17886]
MEPAGGAGEVVPAQRGNMVTLLSAMREMVVPPLNFDMIAPGVYRSGHPNERNFEFLRRLNLRSILWVPWKRANRSYLANDDYRENVLRWAQREGLKVFHHRVTVNKEPFSEMDGSEVASALEQVLDRRNLPVLIHCNKGKYRVGCLVGCLRRLQGWSYISILEEYARFAGERIADEEFIEMFDLGTVHLDPKTQPTWL